MLNTNPPTTEAEVACHELEKHQTGLKNDLDISDGMRSKAGTSKEHAKEISKLLPFFGLLMQLESLNKLCLDFQQTVFIVLYIYSHVISQQLLN